MNSPPIPKQKIIVQEFMEIGDLRIESSYTGWISWLQHPDQFMEILDMNGDLDLIINNLNDQAFIYQNLALTISFGNYLQLNLGNAFGAKVTCFAKWKSLIQGFQPGQRLTLSVDRPFIWLVGQVEVLDSFQLWFGQDNNWPRMVNVKTIKNQS